MVADSPEDPGVAEGLAHRALEAGEHERDPSRWSDRISATMVTWPPLYPLVSS
jgi:hypothetical protein